MPTLLREGVTDARRTSVEPYGACVARPGIDSWLLCATPRSGSTLFCGLLESSGVAGHPASYFNRRGLHDYATRWRVAQPNSGRIDTAYVQAALVTGSTPNGVFGARVMAESRPELLADLSAERVQPAANELDLLVEQFGRSVCLDNVDPFCYNPVPAIFKVTFVYR
ncbi:MAG: hypothetical protein EOO68_28115 [Moraxellaceae bacterium]|nr:MAG: hypothetical protein EOO68_28115 [Moraxellaceae bacterium]